MQQQAIPRQQQIDEILEYQRIQIRKRIKISKIPSSNYQYLENWSASNSDSTVKWISVIRVLILIHVCTLKYKSARKRSRISVWHTYTVENFFFFFLANRAEEVTNEPTTFASDYIDSRVRLKYSSSSAFVRWLSAVQPTRDRLVFLSVSLRRTLCNWLWWTLNLSSVDKQT